MVVIDKVMDTKTQYYWMLKKEQVQDQMMEQVKIWIQARILLAPLIVILVKVQVGKLEVKVRGWIASALGELNCRFRRNR